MAVAEAGVEQKDKTPEGEDEGHREFIEALFVAIYGSMLRFLHLSLSSRRGLFSSSFLEMERSCRFQESCREGEASRLL